MKGLGRALVALLLLAPWAQAQDGERLRNAKALVFDGKYAEAREAWQEILRTSSGAEADAAAFQVARCSENLKQDERALAEYAEFLARKPADRRLGEEARTSRVTLATRLYKAGKKQHLGVVKEALADTSKTVRYYAALQLGSLGAGVGDPALPVLKKIVAEEKDTDLVDRARLTLLRLDPQALTPAPERRAEGQWLKVRIYKPGVAEAKVSINVPVSLAELAFKSLPDDVKGELRMKGYDADNFWDKLRKLGPTEILTIEGDEGERIQIWIE